MFLKGKALFVFSDPGGAKSVLAFAEMNAHLYNEVLIISDRVYPFYKDFNLTVEPYLQNELQIIDNFQPNFIFTGTSYTSKVELSFIRIANIKGIHSLSFIDHWTSMRKRFEEDNGTLIVPQLIYVIDERAKQIAISEGLNEDRIEIITNPYHIWLSNWTPSVSKEQFFHSLGLSITQKKVALYAPDPLSNVNGMADFGFDEISATKELMDVLEKKAEKTKDWIFLVKAHPNQNIPKLNNLIKPGSNFILLKSDVDINNCIFYSDLVIGFFSSLLIEASIMKKIVIRYFPKEIVNDPIKELQIGIVVNKTNLIDQLKWN